MDTHATLARLVAGARLDRDQSRAAFDALLEGRLDPAQIGAMLALIQARGAAVEELVGGAEAMRASVVPVPSPAGMTLIDTCGTGGAPKAFNISTGAAIVAAAAGPALTGARARLGVAKHGNRSRSGRGSAEVLAQLGVNIDADPAAQGRCLDRCGVAFSFAIHHHPAMKHAGPPRRALGFPTIFNLLGPLTNPAGASRQLLGVYDAALVEPMAGALARLSSQRAMVVHGLDGMDELTTTGPSRIAHVRNGAVSTEVFDPASVGIARAHPEDLVARDLGHAAEIIRGIFAGAHGPAREIVALNAAAALLVGEAADGWPEALDAARRAIDSGAARRTLEALIAASHGRD